MVGPIKCQVLSWTNLSRPSICLSWKRRSRRCSNKLWPTAVRSKKIQGQSYYLRNHSSRSAPHASVQSQLVLISPPSPQASTQALALINSLCVMLHTTPFHRENYSRLILGVMIQFYSRCSDRFRDLVSRGESSGAITEVYLSVPASWAQRPEISTCLSNLYISVCFSLSLRSMSHATFKE